MHYSKVFIDSIAYELPPVVVSTSELEERLAPLFDKLHIPEGQLEEWTGIYERRWWDPGFDITSGAVKAARKAMDSCNVHAGDIGMVVYTGVYRENLEPSMAFRIADRLGLKEEIFIHDISNACLGALSGIIDAANRIELGHIRAALVVSAESAREINETMIARILEKSTMEFFISSLATLTGGSGAVAVLVTDGSFGLRQRRILGGTSFAAPQFHEICKWGFEHVRDGMYKMIMKTDSVSVLKNGVNLAEKTWNRFLAGLKWKPEDIGRTICHQVGSAHRDTVLKTLGVSRDRDFITYPFLGNMGTVSLPITAAIAQERGKLREKMKTAFLGIGSGLNCMMLGLEW